MSKSRRFVITINNYTEDHEQAFAEFCEGPSVVYGVAGREVAPTTGTPHLQCFIILQSPQRFSFIQRALGSNIYLEVARAKSCDAAAYCKKEGDFDEYGTLPDSQGKRSDIDEFKDWVMGLDDTPSERSVARHFPSLYLRYRQALLDLVGHLRPQPEFGGGDDLYGWQSELRHRLSGGADDRTVEFIVDTGGNKGKSWFVRFMLTKQPDDVQALSVGKRDDLAYAIDASKSIFLFDVPRGCMEYFQYPVLEQLKNQVIFSTKYQSQTKLLPTKVHVVVLCNEEPDMNAMTEDRYVVNYI